MSDAKNCGDESREYWEECPYGSCNVRFIGATKEEVLDHVEDEHGTLAAFGGELLVSAKDCPECGEYKIRQDDDCCLFCKKEATA